MIAATLYTCAHETAPDRRDEFASWDEFVEALGDLVQVEAPAKEACPYWAPYELAGETRADANVSELSCLVTDLDAIHDVGAIVAALEGTAAFVYESPSSTDLNPRVRIVCPVSRPITRAECAHTRLAFAERLGLEPGCGADGVLPASIGFYAGRVKGTRDRRTWKLDGAPIEVDSLVAAPLHFTWGKRAAKTRDNLAPQLAPRDAVEPALTARVLELAARVEPRWLEGDRELDNFERAFYGWLRGAGWSRAEIVGLVECLDSNEPDASKRREHAKKARAAVALAGPSDAVRAWFADEFADVDAHVSAARREWWTRREERRAREARERSLETPLDTVFGRRHTWDEPDVPLEYYCAGLGLTPGYGKISLIAGDPGSGKGPLASHFALCFATETPIFGAPCRKSRVLLIDVEGYRITMRRLRRMARALGVTLTDDLQVFDASRVDLLDEVVQAELKAYCDEHGIEVVVLDSYTSAMLASGLDANQPEFGKLAKALGGLERLVIAVAHANKAAAFKKQPGLGDIAFSLALVALSQTAIMVRAGEDKNVLEISCARAPETKFEPFAVRFVDESDGDALRVERVSASELAAERETKRGTNLDAGNTKKKIDAEAATKEAMAAIVDHMRTGAAAGESRGELISVGGEGRNAGERALKRLVQSRVLVYRGGLYLRAENAVTGLAAFKGLKR